MKAKQPNKLGDTTPNTEDGSEYKNHLNIAGD